MTTPSLSIIAWVSDIAEGLVLSVSMVQRRGPLPVPGASDWKAVSWLIVLLAHAQTSTMWGA